MGKAYVGKINNQGSQKVEAPVRMPKGKSPKVITGADLRSGSSKK